MTNQKRFQNLKNDRGIRKDTDGGKYVATKSIKGKRITKSFKKLSDAREWQKNFTDNHIQQISNKDSLIFGDAWERYLLEYVSTLNFSTQEKTIRRTHLFEYFYQIRLNEITPNEITNFLLFHKDLYKKTKLSKRCNFNHELKILKSFFNWCREVIDYRLVNPILRRHKQIGKIREVEFKNKKMTPEEIALFFETIKRESPFWFEFALTQFYFAGRVQEIAGLQKISISVARREALIKDVVIWDQGKHFRELKRLPKNGEIRVVYLNDQILEIFQKLLVANENNSFLFSRDDLPLKYREIQYHYNKALKKCGLFPKFSGTHFMRHSMATITRSVTKSLELTQAVTGHRDQKMVQHYAYMNGDNNKLAQIQVESHFEKMKFERHCEQTRTNQKNLSEKLMFTAA